MVDELANARQDALSELRSDLAQLSKAIIDLARTSARVNYAYQKEWRAIYNKYMAWIRGCYDGNLLILMFILSIFMIVQSVLRDTISSQKIELDEQQTELSQLGNNLEDLKLQLGILKLRIKFGNFVE